MVMTVLHPELNFAAPLRETARCGATFVPAALAAGFREALVRELDRAPVEAMSNPVGPYAVRQHGELFFVRADEIANWPAIDRLRRELTLLVHEHGRSISGVAGWEPNEAAVQRYPAASGGIGVHRDGKRYRVLIAIFTVEGTGTLALCTDRQGTVAREWLTTPGSLILLRGPGLDGAEDGRPLHRVQTSTGVQRTSLSFRMDGRLP